MNKTTKGKKEWISIFANMNPAIQSTEYVIIKISSALSQLS